MGLGNGLLIAGFQLQQRSPDASDVRPALEAEDLLDHGVHVPLGGAHFVDDPAALVLDLPSLGQLSGLETAEDLQIQLRHGGVGAADAAAARRAR